MAIRKTGSRRIIVDGLAFRWRIRHRATSCQADYGNGALHVAIESIEPQGAVLVLVTDRLHPEGWSTEARIPVTPSDVADWIRMAMQAGWVPNEPGPLFKLRIVDSLATRIS